MLQQQCPAGPRVKSLVQPFIIVYRVGGGRSGVGVGLRVVWKKSDPCRTLIWVTVVPSKTALWFHNMKLHFTGELGKARWNKISIFCSSNINVCSVHFLLLLQHVTHMSYIKYPQCTQIFLSTHVRIKVCATFLFLLYADKWLGFNPLKGPH